ncbi:scyllo-inositol 2-dehydrogenase (NADP+) [Neolewinella xylanilytica]|uniref:Scyllo-inositol 2-dehydrogenase (NADP+) n=1 Tax=Neolewinella xylanilytica TaxID=1514080 RepID=A0A2S6I8X2_9BACT|nr:Gfo/Idh/MocA family oxidoreductase [Neolewinella xylanilytica]PPK87932.1 scyllo-inositol 2-dehydrogenase (NADP+) [Neolewinella xylanilytica]
MSTSAQLNVGLIGFGLSGRYLQAPFYRAHPGFTVKRVVTSRAEQLAEEFPGLEPTPDADTVLADASIDLVSIATPNATHYEIARAALEAGKHVLVDKPACATAAQLRELRDLAASRDLHLFVFQNRRWDSDFLTVRQVIGGGALGELVNYEARYDRWKPEPNAKPWKEKPGAAAGMLYDLGAHIIDQAIVLFGRPDDVSGATWTQREHSSIPDAFDIQLTYAGPMRVHLSCSLLVREPTPRYTLHGKRGSFVKYGIDVQEDQLKAGIPPGHDRFGEEPAEQHGLLHTEVNGLTVRGPVQTHAGHWMGLFDNMHQVITRGAAPAVPLDDVVLQLEIIERVPVL